MIFAAKYHSYGNDFFIVPADQVKKSGYAGLARAICDPHRGLGADGCVFLSQAGADGAGLRIFNRDGSEAQMSGNGARCACAFLHHRGIVKNSMIRLETRAGTKVYELLRRHDSSWEYRSNMGSPVFEPAAIPFKAPPALQRVEDFPVEVSGETVRVSALFVGNPQCVVFVDELPHRRFFEKVGSGLENHPLFPQRTNVSFVKVENPHRLRILIWERGVGPTLSSGTGSCGAAVAAISAGRAMAPLEVHTETGMQQVEWEAGSEIFLTGCAEFIADVHLNWRAGD